MKKFLSIFLFSLLFLPTVSDAIQKDAGYRLDYNGLSKRLSALEDIIKSGQGNSELINEKVSELKETKSLLLEYKTRQEDSLKTVEKRLTIIGEAPSGETKESAIITQTRQGFNKEKVDITGRIATIDILLAKIEDIEVLMLNLKSQKLLRGLLNRQEPLIYPSEFFFSGKLFVEFLIDILRSPFDWYGNLEPTRQETVKDGLFPIGLIILFSLWLGVYLRLFIMKHFGYKKDIENPRYGNKVSAAIFVAIAYGVIPASIIGGFLIWNITHKVVTTGFFGLIVNSLLFYGLFVILAKAIARVIFAPYNEKWRLLSVSTEKAKKICSAVYFTIIMIGVMMFLDNIVRKANYPLDLITFVSAMSSAIKAFCIIIITKRLFMDDNPDNNILDEDVPENGEDEQLSMAFKVTLSLTVFAFAAFLLSIFGYPTLATFILDKFIISCLIIGVFLIVRTAIKELLHRFLFLTFWSKTFRLRRKMIQKIDFWSFLILEPVIVLSALCFILTVWGVSTNMLLSVIHKLLFGFTIGGIKLSLISIVLGFLVFFISIALVKVMKKKLMNNVLSRMDIDDGIKHSLESGFGFVGFISSLLLAVVVMGGSLTNFALIAGALSFGIGLGLQNIVNNFVSGIVLLFERPVKIGDWVIVNGQEGIVKQVSIRATELETWERSNIIIPNADILSNSLVNLTHTDKVGRIDVAVGVAYGSDTQKVKEILLSVAEEHKKILKKPIPFVVFADFADSSLNFELRAFTSDVMNRLSTASDLRFEIDRLFRENNIEIPFPQRTLHIQTPIKVEENGKPNKKSKKSV
ncbi:MAG: mechanosensitive ion channel [Alphaproteobacteria bacterium]